MPRGPGGDAYTAALRAARRDGYRLAADAQTRLLAAFREAARRIQYDLSRTLDPVSRARGEALRKQVLGVIRELEDRVTATTARGVGLAARDVAAIHAEVASDLYRRELGRRKLPAPVARAFAQIDARAAAVLAASERAKTFRTLVTRNIRDAAPALDTLVTSAVARGVSTRTLTRDIANLLATAEGADLSTYGLADGDVSGLRTLFADSRRIAVTETLNSLRRSQTDALTATGMVAAVKWQLSGAHPDYDECDVLAESDLYDLGIGYYPPDAFPDAPHPHCGCTQGDVQMRPPEDWGTEMPPAEIDPDAEIEFPGDWSEARRARAEASLHRATGVPVAVAPVAVTDAAIIDLPSTYYERARAHQKNTLNRFTTEDGTWTPERQALHDAIVRQQLAEHRPVDDPTVYLVHGGPASGKSTMLAKLEKPPDAVYMDPDAIKRLLPEYKDRIAAGDPSASTYVHEESSIVSKRIAAEAIAGDYNLVVDAVGAGPYEGMVKKVEGYRARGAPVIANYVTMDAETAIERARERARHPGPNFGRTVPVKYIRKSYREIARNMPRMIEDGLFDELTIWDNNGDFDLHVMAEYRNGKLTVRDQTAWYHFLATGND
jgi:predicted ABC-type ATPase